MLSFCLKCRKIGKVKIQVARIKLLSKCAVCDSKKSKFPKQQEPSLLLSKLGIKRSLTLFMMDIFETAHGWGGAKRPPSLKSVIHILQRWNFAVVPYLKKIKKYMNHIAHPWLLLTSPFFTGNLQILLYQKIQV